DLYRKLMHWEQQLERIEDSGMSEILESQKVEANRQFGKFVDRNYQSWFSDKEGPVRSHTLFGQLIKQELKDNKTLPVVIDNLRYDQWMTIEDTLNTFYRKRKEIPYFSILPSGLQYARKSIFSGLTPLDMEKKYPHWWKNDTEEGGKNLFEAAFLEAQLKRSGLDLKWEYHKI